MLAFKLCSAWTMAINFSDICYRCDSSRPFTTLASFLILVLVAALVSDTKCSI